MRIIYANEEKQQPRWLARVRTEKRANRRLRANREGNDKQVTS